MNLNIIRDVWLGMMRKTLNRRNLSKAVLGTMLLFFCVVTMSFTSKVEEPKLPVEDKWTAPASAKSLKNPNTGKASIKNGQKLHKLRCAFCHGETGKGDSPAGKALQPPAADRTSEIVQSQTDTLLENWLRRAGCVNCCNSVRCFHFHLSENRLRVYVEFAGKRIFRAISEPVFTIFFGSF